MKRMIRSVKEASGAEYQLWMELAPTEGPDQLFSLKFSSIWTGAKDSGAAQNKGDFFLEKDDIERIRSLIEDATR